MQKKTSWLFFRRFISSYPAKINLVIVLLLLTTSSFSAGSRFETSWLPENSDSEFQQGTVSGTVLDSKGEPIIGATVSVKGTTLGALTDINGKYSIANVPANSVLTFSFIGMTTQEIALEGKSTINVTLIEATLALEEVVVIGYGTQKKETSVGAVSQMSSDQIMRTGNVTDLRQALGGQIPGVLALQVSGEPGV